ncbi:MAG: hypothetical protein V1739_02695 [Candidatus Omnitrophota bacterium]
MKNKISILWILILSVFVFLNLAVAAPAIIKDIVVDTQDSSVKISITSNQTLQIETFKNDESPANYIVLDFLGTVYTNLPSVIEVDSGPVEKVSLVKGDNEKITLTGQEYYSLDFLAINLNKAADYYINQSQAVIDLNIGTAAGVGAAQQKEAAATEQKAVELTPPIVVSRAKETPAPATYSKSEYTAYSKDTYRPSTSAAEEKSYVSTELIKSEKLVEKKAELQPEKGKIRRKTLFGKKKTSVEEKKEPTPQIISKPEVTQAPVVKEKSRPLPAVQGSESDYLIDRIVNETIRDKENIALRIEDLTSELKRMQEELYLSKGEKSKVEQKINEILAKLDQLQNALDEEIRRRQALGEKVEDLMAKREKYIEAKKLYEEFKNKLARISDQVQNMTAEFKNIKIRLDELQGEKNKLAGEVNVMETEYTQSKTEYDRVVRLKEAVSMKVDKIARELEQLRLELNRQVEEKAQITAQLKGFEDRSKYSGMELARLKQLLQEKDAVLLDLTGKYTQLKVELDAVVAEKFKVEYSYQNARTEFDRIKADIEKFLQESQR